MSEIAINYLDEQRSWREVAGRALGPNPELVAVSRWISHSRVYATADRVAKIRSPRSVAPPRVGTLRHEGIVFERLGTPHEYLDDSGWQILMTARVAGRTLAQMAPHLSMRTRLSILRRVMPALRALHRAGVAHCDLRLDNIVVEGDGTIRLIDFDRAILAPPLEAAIGDWIGVSRRGLSWYPFWKLAAYLLVPKSETLARRAIGKARRLLTHPSEALAHVNPTLARAWQIAADSSANAPGQRQAYYSMTFGDVLLPGERPWTLRWEAIRRAVDFRGRTVLELGCNMGLLSSFAMLEGATSAHGVDWDAPILEAARLTASALGVTPTFEQVDLANDVAWEDLAGRDIVVAMSVVQWLRTPARVLSFLATHPIAIYEGHEDLTTEIARLRQAGFSHVTSLLDSERGRHVLLARKL